MSRPSFNPTSLQSKVELIKAGVTKKTDLGVKENQNIVQGKGGKYHVFQKEKKFEEAGVRRKKRNYVLYESKLGTERETNLLKINEPKPAPKPKPKPKPVARPRMEEKIITQKKRREYLDNYQYLESKVIRNPDPRKVSIVEHKRLSDIISGFYEEVTYQRTMNDNGKMYSQRTTSHVSRPNLVSNPKKLSQKTFTSSRTVPAQPLQYRKEVNAPKGNIRGNKTITTTTKTTMTRSHSRPDNIRGTTTTTQQVNRSQSSRRRY